MPPKALRRPAGAGIGLRGAGGAPVARAKGKALAKAVARVGKTLRRPATRGEEFLGGKEVSEVFQDGQEVAVDQLELSSWRVGVRVIFTEAVYWEEKVKVAGVVKGLQVDEGQTLLRLKLEGTQSEALVKWAGAHPGKTLEVHLCPVDCSLLSKDGLLHAQKARLLTPSYKEAWMDNVIDVAAPQDEQEADKLQKIRERAAKREAERAGEQRAPVVPEAVGSSSSSVSSRARKRKKKKEKTKKAKKKELKEKRKITGTKDLQAVFGTTALDPTPAVRKRVRKRARRAARKKGRKGTSSQSSSGEESSDSQTSVEDPGHLFGEEVKVKMVSKRFPGALTLNTLEMIQGALVSQSGQPWDIDRSSLPPLYIGD